jgi:hypothetical protein
MTVSQGIVREVVAVSFGILDEQTAGHRVLKGLDGLDLVAPTDLPNQVWTRHGADDGRGPESLARGCRRGVQAGANQLVELA